MVTCHHSPLILKQSSMLQSGASLVVAVPPIAFILKAPTGNVAARRVQLADVLRRDPAFVHSRCSQSRSAGFKCLSGSAALTLGPVAGQPGGTKERQSRVLRVPELQAARMADRKGRRPTT
ncbi:hypothetical protein D4764_12G0001320 [Takifugu flavidus]|uniref:Uncharacterized protein n=1 Tax=Takifugu flavidus TaxID=433684 RepID=A0A5C6PAI0_9TELE|nr:hypothetical protein D4764_12G0001320 [Takifugu flavidus]